MFSCNEFREILFLLFRGGVQLELVDAEVAVSQVGETEASVGLTNLLGGDTVFVIAETHASVLFSSCHSK